MKARVKATGEIIEVEPESYIANDKWDIGIRFTDDDNNIYREYQLDFEDLTQGKADVKEKSLPKDEPDYWEKLKHQYTGMAMQGILANPEMMSLDDIDVAAMAIRIANITISKLKEESQCKR